MIYAILLFSGSNSCLITRKHKTRIATDTFFSEFCNNRLIDCNHTTKSHQKLKTHLYSRCCLDSHDFKYHSKFYRLSHHCLQVQDKSWAIFISRVMDNNQRTYLLSCMGILIDSSCHVETIRKCLTLIINKSIVVLQIEPLAILVVETID